MQYFCDVRGTVSNSIIRSPSGTEPQQDSYSFLLTYPLLRKKQLSYPEKLKLQWLNCGLAGITNSGAITFLLVIFTEITVKEPKDFYTYLSISLHLRIVQLSIYAHYRSSMLYSVINLLRRLRIFRTQD